MSDQDRERLVLDVLEGLINFIANPKPDQDCRDKALRGLIALKNEAESLMVKPG